MRQFWLFIRNGESAGRAIEVRQDRPLRLGSGVSADVVLTDPRISREHCAIEVVPQGLRIRDLSSRYGTFVNAERLTERLLRHQDKVSIGDTSLVVMAADEPETKREAAFAQDRAPGRSGHLLPQEIAGYQRCDLIARGGAAEVHLVRRRSDGASCAMKLLRPVADAEGKSIDRFRNEIQLLQGLSHPNIVHILECGALTDPRTPGEFQPWFTMEYCPGGSAEDLLRRRQRPLTLSETEPILMQALGGLAHLHQKRIVHRDVNPKNLLLTEREGGTVKLTDFGLAKLLSNEESSGITTAFLPAIGTFGFVPREQLLNFKFVSFSADVWSMAATVYFLLTGEAPYDFPDAPTEMEAIEALLRSPIVPIAKRAHDLPARFAEVIDRALEEDPQHRPATATDLRKAIEQAL